MRMQICTTKRKIWVFIIFTILNILILQSCGYGIYHRVQKGETLDKIARKYNVPEKEIINANKKGPFFFDPQKIKEGDIIYIPLDKAERNNIKETDNKKSENINSVGQEKEAKTEENNQSLEHTKRDEKIGETNGESLKKNELKNSALKKNENNKSKLSEVLGTKPNIQKNIQPKQKETEPPQISIAKADLMNEKRIKPKDINIGLKFITPVQGKIISEFGPRNGKMHKGIDIQAPEGENIKAAEDGVVIFSGFLKGYGNVIIIKHEGDFFTVYAHNRINLVKEGEFVKKGQVIGKVGMTGNAQIPHLHFEVRKKTKPLNPTDFISISD
ncbi:MAG: LysM peptidoglycan-binding domain-containing M23 family metallopeptidase [Candidatus Calescibacterium sp.]